MLCALGWALFVALYFIGLTSYIVQNRHAWARQGLHWSIRDINRKVFAWPVLMVIDIIGKLRA